MTSNTLHQQDATKAAEHLDVATADAAKKAQEYREAAQAVRDDSLTAAVKAEAYQAAEELVCSSPFTIAHVLDHVRARVQYV